MPRYYYICHKCRKIVLKRITGLMLGIDQYCSCGNKTEVIVDHPKIPNIDNLLSCIEAELVYYSNGWITPSDGKFIVDLPLFRFKDNQERFVSTNLYLRNARLSFDPKDKIYDVFCYEAETIFDTKLAAERALNKYNGWIKIALDAVFHMLNIKNTPKSRYAHTSARFIPIREADREKVYYCPICGNIGVVTTRTKTSTYMLHQDIKFTNPVEISEVYICNHVRCITCNDYMVEIDSCISDQVEKMNKIGIETEYCCQGHFNMGIVIDVDSRSNSCEPTIDYPYIAIYANKYDNEELINLICNLVDGSKYKYLDLEFVDDDGYEESEEYTKLRIYGNIEDIDENHFKTVQKEFIEFLNDLIAQYETIDR